MYPDRGAIVRDLPQGATVVNYAGISYRFSGGVWYEPRGPAYIVVAPPIGLIVPALPAFATSIDSRGKTYLYANEVFYRSRPELGGYEVVNDPMDATPGASPASAGMSRPAPATPIPIAAPQPGATPETAPPPTSSVAVQTPVRPKVAAAPAVAQIPIAAPRSGAAPRAASPPAPSVSAQAAGKAKITAAPAAAAPADSSSPPSELSNPTRVAIEPGNGQSADQQARDRYECYRFAVAQSGFDPLGSIGGASTAEATQARSAYARAQAGCLEARGYAVR
ncbi:MAG: hypothetical protein KGO22_10520 [Gammaproteobacteria bacterium]|nr:hypothetical protein [Gammaproteobacteria bacterium]